MEVRSSVSVGVVDATEQKVFTVICGTTTISDLFDSTVVRGIAQYFEYLSTTVEASSHVFSMTVPGKERHCTSYLGKPLCSWPISSTVEPRSAICRTCSRRKENLELFACIVGRS